MFGGDSLYWGGDSGDLWKYGAGEWTWMGADSVTGIYGSEGSAAAGNIPGARNSAASWTDAVGNFWMFGGFGFDSTGTSDDLNDLWKYSAGEWTWAGGSNVISAKGTYGTKGTAAADNIPGARADSVRWTDAAGNVWLFGGYGYDSAGKDDALNDLWKYSAGKWTWMGGPNVSGREGTYGTRGTPAAGNIPGARWAAVGWVDAAGNMWLFGGFVQNAAGVREYLNDLWKYEP
jgi:N-acetylneuraminic acid mutarotase